MRVTFRHPVDVRSVVVYDVLLSYHGSTPQRIAISEILADIAIVFGKTVDLERDDIDAGFLVPATASITWGSIVSFEIISSEGKEIITTELQMGEPVGSTSTATSEGIRTPFSPTNHPSFSATRLPTPTTA